MKKNKTYKFLISGGGTGGHIFPALSIAKEIKRVLPDARILFVGAEGRMEKERVPRHGFEIVSLPIAGLQRKFTLKNLLLPIKVIRSVLKAIKIIDRFQPDAVIGTGGYVSAPVVWAAQFRGIPTFVQEQNSYPGLTNRFLGRKANKIFTAYEEASKYFPAGKIQLTGNPVRAELTGLSRAKEEDYIFFGLQPGKPVVLILGGSLGSASINRAIAQYLQTRPDHKDFQILWQTGKLYYDRYKHLEQDDVKIKPFIREMDRAYTVADVIISRAGAGTLSELALVGKPVILIPSKNVSEDHQTKNALSLVKKDAALMLREEELHTLFETVKNLFQNEDKMKSLAANIRKTAKPDATKEIVRHILDYLKEKA